MDLQRTSNANLTELKLMSPYLNNNGGDQAGKFSIQIKSTYRTVSGEGGVSDRAMLADPLEVSNRQHRTTSLALANGDASYESPEVKEATRVIR